MARAILFGTTVSQGIAIGRVNMLQCRFTGQEIHIPPSHVPDEIAAFEQAALSARVELERVRDNVPDDMAENRGIIDSHILICQDPKLLEKTRVHIRERNLSAASAVELVVEEVCAAFRAMDDPYLRDRAQDIRAVGLRILTSLSGERKTQKRGASPIVWVAEDLSPADILDFDIGNVMALLTSEGGPTSHTAILARSRHIPALVGVTGIFELVRDDDLVIVDALHGRVLIEPSEDEIGAYAKIKEDFASWEKRVRTYTHLPAETLDGVRVSIEANIENVIEAGALKMAGAEGVGLYRTEFSYLAAPSLPKEDDLYKEYAQVARSIAPKQVIFRSIDLGSDKMLPGQAALKEANPALGLRAIRFCLRHQNIFRTQIRAILRAAAEGEVALMLPMISGLREVLDVRQIIDEEIQNLSLEGKAHNPNLPLGIMIEIPSTVLIADALAKECDFFSIGTNDLAHYMLAIDRGNKHVEYLHEPLHPALVRSIKHVIDSAHREGITACICGELAADPYCLPLLVGMGIDGLSVNLPSVPVIKHLIRNLNFSDCHALAHSVLMATTVESANKIVGDALAELLRDEADFHTTMIHLGK